MHTFTNTKTQREIRERERDSHGQRRRDSSQYQSFLRSVYLYLYHRLLYLKILHLEEFVSLQLLLTFLKHTHDGKQI